MERPPVTAFLRAVLFLVLLFQPALAPAQNFSLVSDTIVRMWEPEVEGSDDLSLPIYEYLQLDVGDPNESPLTFHLYGWGRAELMDNDYYEEVYGGDTAGEVLYAYLQYARPEANLDIRVGRQYLFEGVARNESLDGLRVASDLGDLFSVSLYTGQPVDLDSENGREGDYHYGGRIAHHQRGRYEVALSYKSVDNDDDRAEEEVGSDLSLFLPGGVSVSGSSVYDLENDGWSEHFYSAAFRVGPLRVRPSFEHFRFEEYFEAGQRTPGTFRFLAGQDEKLTIFGGDILLEKRGGLEVGARAKHYEYDKRDENAQFYALLAVLGMDGLSQIGGEFGRMDGDSKDNRYFLGRAYAFRDGVNSPYVKFVTGDVVYVFYDEEIYGEDDSLTLSLGAGNRFLNDRLEIRVAGEYNTTPYFDNELRGWVMARLAYASK